jgi:hypothetical protein
MDLGPVDVRISLPHDGGLRGETTRGGVVVRHELRADQWQHITNLLPGSRLHQARRGDSLCHAARNFANMIYLAACLLRIKMKGMSTALRLAENTDKSFCLIFITCWRIRLHSQKEHVNNMVAGPLIWSGGALRSDRKAKM